ncbi:hypothetical protein PHJA_000095100 [Phtheirospermum japonicum]|uniref:C2 NT-type domain-containing protein n=1 Tax=Phtheirospermum japonicum TaxID=374723 RepID=A0A830AZ83_9LAMI|nr:hypothetical protein PHJA_000095100 [Phtheirospermum japonicum]
MFKSARWRSERNKVKVVFKLQFHAAKVPQVEDDALMVSVVPADAGKPTVKSDKSSVRDGGCFWENPVYESVKFNRDPKSGKIHERIYYFVVGTGSSSKSGVIGEASIDFSNYAEATNVSMVSLPLKCSKMDAILNVSIQRLQESIDHREVEEIENAKSNYNENAKSNYKDHSLKAQLENGDTDGTAIKSNSDDVPFNKTVSHIAERNGARRVSSVSDITMSSSESDTVHHEWLRNSALEAASTDDSLSTPRDELLFGQHHLNDEPSDDVEKLKSEVASLSRQAEMSELELQTLRKQIVKESKRGQDLFKELVCLKEERDALKGECVKIKTAKTRNTNSQFDGGDCWEIVDELRQELNHAKELNSNLQIQLRKTQESNSELILAVKDLDEMLEMKNKEISTKKEVGPTTNDEKNEDEEQKALEELVKDHGEVKEAYLLEQQIIDMRGEIEMYKRDKDEMEMQMEQLALDYEIMKQENHEMAYRIEQSEIQEQLKMQYECSLSYMTAQELEAQIENLDNELKRRSDEVSELEARVGRLEEDLEKQSEGFEADLEALMRSRVEQEQRAIRAEETLRKTQWQNGKTAEKLQEEFKRLFVQMGSTFEANEKVATKAIAEANELRKQKSRLEEIIKKASEEERLQLKNQKDEILNRALMNELEQMKITIKEMELLLKRRDGEKIELGNRITLLKGKSEETEKELNKMICVVEEKELLIEKMQSELDLLRSHCTELERTVSEDDLEKDVLRKQLFLFKGDLKKKDDALDDMEKKFTRVENLKKRIKLLEDQIKAKESALETSYHAFLDKENGLYNKIGELEGRLEVLVQSSIRYCSNEVEKAAALAEDKDPNLRSEEARNCDDDDDPANKKNRTAPSLTSNDSNLPGATNCCADNTKHLDNLSNEMGLLKQRNQLMEVELLEMQERYSEISVKFAEVEGERQQLVMRVRNLKNAKKRS